ncbi:MULTISPECIES: hypothetical protein [Xanthomonas]|uniref:Uncharacterized protein n=1 Tax=Xanthomonas hortorum pv. hederae TaxID=453603 RepID=A0A9X4H1D3_9XANT|nr:hypothetical protein [Xanthomonas arboricola]MDC8638259.1 hypothetical protein [Xanthomonas hortorum pv. hederae]PPU13551.1 hypothetical protein XarjCFBP1022_00090 [Xanthomonas arboricola]
MDKERNGLLLSATASASEVFERVPAHAGRYSSAVDSAASRRMRAKVHAPDATLCKRRSSLG